jgi:hypothetical protein
MKSRILKLSTLVEHNACSGQTKLFKKMFGNSVRVTEKLCLSVADKFNFSWAARNLLTPEALAEYCRVTAPALAEYDRVTASAWAEYDRVAAPAWAEYCRVAMPVWAEYDRVTASAFARGYLS